MKKRMLTMLLALMMIVSVLPFSAMAAEETCAHTAGTYIEREESNCLYKGAIYYFCKDCDKLVWVVEKELTDHTYGADYKCTVCGTSCKKHNYDAKVTVAATCTKEGSVTETCKVCGYKNTVKTMKATGHKFTKSVEGLVATCTMDGHTPYKECSVCGEKNGDYAVIEAKGHVLETTQDKAPTCTKGGVFEQKCKNCEYVNTLTIKKTGHNYTDVAAKAPTCTEEGYNAYKVCTNCGKKQGYAAIAVTGHTYENGQCIGCGAAAPDYAGTSKPNKNCQHPSKSTYTTSPDCTVVGYTVLVCDDCHAELSRVITEATGHTEKTTRQAPTCTEDGFVKVTCKTCKTQISYTILEHFGHNYVNGICTRCGGADSAKYTNDLQDVFLLEE